MKSKLTSVLYVYLEPEISVYAKQKGLFHFGSTSAYLNYLISKDMGIKDSEKNLEKQISDKLKPSVRARKKQHGSGHKRKL